MNIEDEVNFFDILMKRYSPEVISYIDNPSADPYRIITIILLKLEQKEKIKLNKYGRIEIITRSPIGLTESEKFVLDRIKDDGRLVLYNFLKLKYVIFKEGKANGLFTSISERILLSKRQGVLSKLYIIPTLYVIWAFAYYYLYMFLDIYSESIAYFNFSICILMFIILLIAAPSFSYKVSELEKKTFARTEIAEDINKRIDGLKLSLVNDYDTFRNWKNFDEFLFILGLNENEINRFKPCISIYKNDDQNNIKRLGD